MKEVIRDIFFDLDHTLWDFERNSALTFAQRCANAGVTAAQCQYLATHRP